MLVKIPAGPIFNIKLTGRVSVLLFIVLPPVPRRAVGDNQCGDAIGELLTALKEVDGCGVLKSELADNVGLHCGGIHC